MTNTYGTMRPVAERVDFTCSQCGESCDPASRSRGAASPGKIVGELQGGTLRYSHITCSEEVPS